MTSKCPLLIVSTYHPEHAQKVVRRLGIQYLYAVPQPIGSCWQFYCCENIPDDMPDDDKRYIDLVLDYKNMHRSVGYGLSKEMADEIQLWLDKNYL